MRKALIIAMYILLGIATSCRTHYYRYLNEASGKQKTHELKPNEIYIFDNIPYHIGNLSGEQPSKKHIWNHDCLWSYIELDYYYKDSLMYQYQYLVSMELYDNNKIHCKLIDSTGNVIREKSKKFRKRKSPYLSIGSTDWDIYVLFNRYSSKNASLAIVNREDLIVLSEYSLGAFIGFFPFAGSNGYTSKTYRRVTQE